MSDKDAAYRELLEEFYPHLSDQDSEVRIVSTLTTPERAEELRKQMEDGQVYAYLEWPSETLRGSVIHLPQGNKGLGHAVPIIPGKVWIMPSGSLPSGAIRQQADFLGFPTYTVNEADDPYRIHESEIKGNFVPDDPPATDE